MKTLPLLLITTLSVFIAINISSAFAKTRLNNAILLPFKGSELVLVGKVIEAKNTPDENKTQYSIAVEKYLKNPKPFDLLTAVGYGIRKEVTDQFQQSYFNQPVFEKGDRVFLYLNQKGGQYNISPFSFLISKTGMISPPGSATIRPDKNNHYGNENVSILGVIDKGYMYTSAAEYGANSTVSIIVYNPKHEKCLSDQVDVKPDGSFVYQFKIKGTLGISGTYESDINVGSGGYGTAFNYVANPLKQFQSGIPIKGITCLEDQQLIIKAQDSSPACVKPQTAQKLVERGWAKQTTNAIESSAISNSLVDIISIQMVPPPNPGGPIIQLTLKNIGMKTITNLKATLELNNDYTFDFKDITESKPLTSGHSTFDTQILIGAGFRTELAYPLTISGIANNIPFRYSVNIYISS